MKFQFLKRKTEYTQLEQQAMNTKNIVEVNNTNILSVCKSINITFCFYATKIPIKKMSFENISIVTKQISYFICTFALIFLHGFI